MTDQQRDRQTNPAQDTQETTREAAKEGGLDLNALFQRVPPAQAQAIKEAAGRITGKDPGEMTLQEAVKALEQGDPNQDPETAAEIDRLAAEAFDGIPAEKLAQLAEALAGDPGAAQVAAEAAIDALSGAAQPAQEVQDDTGKPPKAIVIDTGDYDPRLDPESPEFDREAWQQAVDSMAETMRQGQEAIRETVSKAVNKMANDRSGAMQESMRGIAESLSGTITAAQKNMGQIPKLISSSMEWITEYVNSPQYQELLQKLAALREYEKQVQEEEAAYLEQSPQQIQDLAPYLKAEIEEEANKPDSPVEILFPALTLKDLIEQGFDADGNSVDGPFLEIIQRAEAQLQTTRAAEELAALPRIISNPTELINYPLDKPNSKIWGLLEEAPPNGQLQFDIQTNKKGSKQEALVYYGISFDEMGMDVRITRQLTPFDKRVYIAAAALFNSGNDTVSTSQIYRAMGYSKSPPSSMIKKINDSLTKMSAAHVTIDNAQEATVLKNYPVFKYDASLLPFERKSAYINNILTEAAIHLFREPPLISFARERKQITTLSRAILESPVNKTDGNLRLEDYLLERIGHMKKPNSKTPRKMLYATIFERCSITDKKQRQRAPQTITRYLEHYKKCGHIAGYAESKDGVTIIL